MEIYARDLLAMDLILAKYPADARAVLRKIVKWIALTLWQGMFFGLWILCGQELAIRIIPNPRVIE